MRNDRSFVVSAALACLLAAPLARAGILEPGDRTLVAEGRTVVLRDVYSVGDTLDVATSEASACTVYDARRVAVAWIDTRAAGDAFWASYEVKPSDVLGEWKVTCGASSVWFRVVDGHRRLWLDQDRFEGLIDDYRTAGGARSTYSWSTPPFGTTPYWVNNNGWYYLQYTAVPGYSSSFAEKIPTPAGKVIGGISQEPWEMLYFSGGMAAGQALQRIALLAAFVDEYSIDPTTTIDPAELQADTYQRAVEYWGDYLVSIPDWSAATLPGVYQDLTGRIVYCSGPSCWVKDSAGAALPFSGSKTALTTSFDDIERGQLLFALAAAYDWVYPRLGPDRRREWADKLVEETLRYQADEGLPRPWSTYQPNHRRSVATNTHVWLHHAAIGVVALALRDELSPSAPLRDQWLNIVNAGFDVFLDQLGSDGADHNGVGYWEFGIEILLRYIEARRGILGETRFYSDAWLANSPNYFLHLTHPNRQRVSFGDSNFSDRSSVGALLARLASQYRSPLAQRLAWEGHNRWSFGRIVRRDVLDLLWWDESVAPLTDLTKIETDACFPDHGLVSVRSGWGSDAAHLAYLGGPVVGVHDDPAVGSFVLYHRGHLVTDDGENAVSKRTALHSTLLVDGKGQHGDGMDMMTQAPDGIANNGRLTMYLDNSAAGDIGVRGPVTFGSDLTQMYRYDATDVRYDGSTQVDTSTKRLTELTRRIAWFGDAAVVLDRFAGTGSFRIDWLLQAGKVLDANADGVEDAAEVATCPVQPGIRSGYFSYQNSSSATTSIGLWSDRIRYCTSATCPTVSADFIPLNLYRWAPVRNTTFTAYRCDDHVVTTGSAATIRAASGLGGVLDVQPLDTASTSWEKQASTDGAGGRITGTRLVRRQAATSGVFVTALLPYTAAVGPTASVAGRAVTGGFETTVTRSTSTATVLLATPGSTVVTGTNSNSAAVLGVVVRDGAGVPRVGQMERGTSLIADNVRLIGATAPVNAGFTWEDDSAWGTVQTEASVTVDVALRFAPASVTAVWVGGVPVTDWIPTATGVRMTVPRSGTVVIRSNLGDGPSGPGSVCNR